MGWGGGTKEVSRNIEFIAIVGMMRSGDKNERFMAVSTDINGAAAQRGQVNTQHCCSEYKKTNHHRNVPSFNKSSTQNISFQPLSIRRALTLQHHRRAFGFKLTPPNRPPPRPRTGFLFTTAAPAPVPPSSPVIPVPSPVEIAPLAEALEGESFPSGSTMSRFRFPVTPSDDELAARFSLLSLTSTDSARFPTKECTAFSKRADTSFWIRGNWKSTSHIDGWTMSIDECMKIGVHLWILPPLSL